MCVHFLFEGSGFDSEETGPSLEQQTDVTERTQPCRYLPIGAPKTGRMTMFAHPLSSLQIRNANHGFAKPTETCGHYPNCPRPAPAPAMREYTQLCPTRQTRARLDIIYYWSSCDWWDGRTSVMCCCHNFRKCCITIVCVWRKVHLLEIRFILFFLYKWERVWLTMSLWLVWVLEILFRLILLEGEDFCFLYIMSMISLLPVIVHSRYVVFFFFLLSGRHPSVCHPSFSYYLV